MKNTDLLFTLIAMAVVIISMMSYFTFLDSKLDPFCYDYGENLNKPKSFMQKFKDCLIEMFNTTPDKNDTK